MLPKVIPITGEDILFIVVVVAAVVDFTIYIQP